MIIKFKGQVWLVLNNQESLDKLKPRDLDLLKIHKLVIAKEIYKNFRQGELWFPIQTAFLPNYTIEIVG